MEVGRGTVDWRRGYGSWGGYSDRKDAGSVKDQKKEGVEAASEKKETPGKKCAIFLILSRVTEEADLVLVMTLVDQIDSPERLSKRKLEVIKVP